ncbi:MAG: SIR2 family protein [Eubacteriales bacterium]
MQIVDWSNVSEQNNLLNEIKTLIKVKRLVPIIGAGFTSGTETRHGTVPNGNELKDFLIRQLELLLGMGAEDTADLKRGNLSATADIYWNALEKSKKITTSYENNLMEYMEGNFSKVKTLEQHLSNFLNCNWRYIYTLNFDDAIESTIRGMEIIVPYSKQNKRRLEKKNCLYKIHGDIGQFLKTGDPNYCILSKKQYIDAITSEHNRDMLSMLQNDFYSNSIIFIGCGLDEELDLLFASELKLVNKSKIIDDTHKAIYYVYYDEKRATEKDIPKVKQLKLENYGVTNAIWVKSIKELKSFCNAVYECHLEAQKIMESDELDKYNGIRFQQLDKSNNDSIRYLFYSDTVRIEPKTKTITLPSFFIKRSITRDLIRDFDENCDVIQILYGNRFSGKTYCLFDIMQELYAYNTYYFPSDVALDDKVLSRLLETPKTLLLFDEGSITLEQMRSKIFECVGRLKSQMIHIILVVNKADKDFARYYFSNRSNFVPEVKFYEVKNRFINDDNKLMEISEFNMRIAVLSLVDYRKNNSILDYLIHVEKGVLNRADYKLNLPSFNILSSQRTDELKAMIILASKGTISSQNAIDYGIDESMYNICKNAGSAVQRDYLYNIEITEDSHSGYKFVANSQYWIFRCLSKFADEESNHMYIAQAYYSIIYDSMSLYKLTTGEMNLAFYREIKPYYLLDNIQSIFSKEFSGGTIRLPNKIYEKLHPLLTDNYHFLHQEAKCKLRYSRRIDNTTEKKEQLDIACRNIGRAYDLAERRSSPYIEYTLGHMLVTKALILTNYVLTDNYMDAEKVLNTIIIYFKVFVESRHNRFLSDLERNEMSDVKAFCKYLGCNFDKHKYPRDIGEKANQILSEVYGKSIRLS